MTNRYSLANYILSIEPNDLRIKNIFGVLSIGGEGSSTSSVSVTTQNNLFTTQGYSTGGWVHNKNLSRTGTLVIDINQISDKIEKLIRLTNMFYSKDYNGFTLTLSDINGNKIATCIDCYIQNIPSQSYQSSAQDQSWSFTCGQINYNS